MAALKIWNGTAWVGVMTIKGDTGTAGTNGIRGSRISQGTTITGTVATGTVFSGSGITDALINDTYINNAAWNVYKCLLGGVAATATWAYIGNIKGVDGAGAGDMLKATYDTTNNGVVDNAEKVNNHTVDTDVPTGAVFTDTVYTHPTTAGNKHVPSGGAANQVLIYSADGTAAWGADPLALPIAGGTLTGILIAQNNTFYTTAQMRNVILSTADAVLGSMGNGDIWVKFV